MKILVTTCDKNAYVLPIFFHFFGKFWADCPWPVTVIGGPKTEGGLDHYEVFRGDDAVWSELLLSYLDTHDKDEPVLILLEDYIISDYIDTKRVNTCRNLLLSDPAVQFVRLNPCPGPTLPWIDFLKIGRFDKASAPYLSSLMPTIFRVSYLYHLLHPGWTAWDVEIKGTEIARHLPGVFLGSTEVLVPVMNYLVRGRVSESARKEVAAKW